MSSSGRLPGHGTVPLLGSLGVDGGTGAGIAVTVVGAVAFARRDAR